MVRSQSVVVRGVTRRFGSAWVLRGVDATFEAGTLTVVYGANGAGKSTLMGIVGGLIQPTAGEVVWVPESARGESRGSIGWVGHESSSYRELTVRENISFVADAHGLAHSVVADCVKRVGADSFVDRRVGMLSRGQKQRVALARGIVHSPALLLLDEPFTGLDARGCEMLEAILLEERARGVIVLVVSHDGTLAERLGAVALWIERGRVRASK